MSELSDLVLRQGREMYELGKKHGTIETLMNLKANKINLKTKVQYCDCCGVKLSKDNNKCGYCICDKCNARLERECKGV